MRKNDGEEVKNETVAPEPKKETKKQHNPKKSSAIVDANGSIIDPYRNFIAVSRYARWDDEKGRRETWEETVNRYIAYQEKIIKKINPKAGINLNEIRDNILNHNVMPSMRALMTSGPALDRCNVAAYNCSFVGVDSPRSFDEAMYILMCGTGVGFSVESKYVDQLPVVNEHFEHTDTTIIVQDSKAGWARAFRELLALLWQGQIPNWDMSKVRPAGSRLKIFGGRASGPGPLDDLFKFSVEIFTKAAGRKLKPLECHDIMCKVGDVVVSGGVRRSALISLSNLEDYDMARAKSGNWWDTDGQRALANNSAVYENKPSVGEFLQEWNHLYQSKSGERGIFSLQNAQKTANATGRRDGTKVAGTNPSLVPGTLVWTDGGIREIQDLEGETFYIRNLNGELSPAHCWKSGDDKTVYEVSLAGGHKYYATKEHKWPVLINGVWTRTKTTDLKPGDKLKNTLHNNLFHGTEGTYDEGFLIGWNLGDGWQTSRRLGLQIGFVVSEEDRQHGNIDEKITKTLASLGSTAELITKDEINVNNAELRSLFVKYGVQHKSEGLPLAVWDSNISDDFRKGLIDGLFSADGSVNVADGRITFVQKSEKMINDISALLGFFGVQSHKQVRSTSGRKAFGWKNTYDHEDQEFIAHTLRIGEIENIQHFASIFKLSRTDKQEKINTLVNHERQKGEPKNQFIEIVSVVEYGTSDVWDIAVDDTTHAFRLSHAITGNCITGDSLLMTETGWIRFDEAYLKGTPNNIVVDGRVSYNETADGIEHPQNWVHNKGVSYDPKTMHASKMFLTQENAEIVKVETSSGYSVRLTPDHLVMTQKGMVEAGSLQSGDKIFITRGYLPTAPLGKPLTLSEKEAILMGLIAGDGTFTRNATKTDIATIVLWGEDKAIAGDVVEWINTIQQENEMNIYPLGNKPFSPAYATYVDDADKVVIKSTFLVAHLEKKYGFTADTKHQVPNEFITHAVSREARFYVAALAFCDGTVNTHNKVGSSSVRINQSNRKMLSDVQLVMLANGINSSLYSRRPAGTKSLPDGNGGMKDHPVKENFELVFMANAHEFVTYVGFLNGPKQVRAENIITESRKRNAYATVTSVTPDGREDVYCLQEDERRILCANGITMRRCGEILLRNKGFCNLSEVVVRQDDTLEDLKEKVRVATIIGTIQSTLTDFKYLRKVWKDNAEEERLLGVSLTGQFGHPVLSGGKGLEELEVWLSEMKQVAIATNEKLAEKLGIPVSAAITTVKPSGTASQLTGVASGMHPWHSEHYIRSVRGDNKDPLTQFLKDVGIPNEPDVTKPLHTTVFYFPVGAPSGSVTRDDLSALRHLEMWKAYKMFWTEHNPSITVTVREDEWVSVAAWVYENWEYVGGISFLPHSDHTYKQAPYQEVDAEEFADWVRKMPADIDWSQLSLYELEDATTGSQELACSAGACDIADITSSSST